MKLSDWARQNGVHPKTALRWFDRGILPVPARKVGPRTILVEIPSGGDDAVALYARVSHTISATTSSGRWAGWWSGRRPEGLG